jgi:uncharacterized membrane protein
MKRLISYFLQGLLFIVPIAVTLFVLYKVFILVDGILPFDVPGLGLLIILGIITLTGLVGSTIVARPIVGYFEKLINKAPLVKIIYSAVKDLMSGFLGTKKSFDKPVLVKLSADANIYKLGFVTNDDLTELGVGPGMVSVYLPHSYAWSGNQFIVSKECVTPLKVSPATVMKFIVSGGVSNVVSEGENGKEN